MLGETPSSSSLTLTRFFESRTSASVKVSSSSSSRGYTIANAFENAVLAAAAAGAAATDAIRRTRCCEDKRCIIKVSCCNKSSECRSSRRSSSKICSMQQALKAHFVGPWSGPLQHPTDWLKKLLETLCPDARRYASESALLGAENQGAFARDAELAALQQGYQRPRRRPPTHVPQPGPSALSTQGLADLGGLNVLEASAEIPPHSSAPAAAVAIPAAAAVPADEFYN
ncbi:hypothetical protein Emed_004395 [Eimeria media]